MENIDKLNDFNFMSVLVMLDTYDEYIERKVKHKVICVMERLSKDVIQLKINVDLGEDISPRFLHVEKAFTKVELMQGHNVVRKHVEETIPQIIVEVERIKKEVNRKRGKNE